MKKKKSDLGDLLELNGELQSLANDLVSSIKSYGKFSKHGMSPHMKDAIRNYETFIEGNFTRIPWER